MKKIILLTAIGLFLASPSWAATYYVDAEAGNDSGTGTETDPWQTATKTMNEIGIDDTVYFKGTFLYWYDYADTLDIVQDGATLANWPGFEAIFEYVPMDSLFNVQGDNITFSGLTFQASDYGDLGTIGIDLDSATDGITVADCVFLNPNFSAVRAENYNQDVTISHNIISGATFSAIYLDGVTGVDILGNEITGTAASLYGAIHVAGSSAVNINGNYIHDDLSLSNIQISDLSSDVIVTNNIFANNADTGVYNSGGAGIEIYNNTFYSCDRGLGDAGSGGSNLTAKNNIFVDDELAIGLDEDSEATLDNNLYYQNEDIGYIDIEGSDWSHSSTLSEWQEAWGQDENSVDYDPKFTTDQAGCDYFQLQRTSGAIDLGADISAVEDDFWGITRTYGSHDIGAYEYAETFSTGKVKNVEVKKYDDSVKVKISWKKVSGASKYQVKITTSKGEVVKNYTKVKKKYKVVKDLKEKKYKIKVRAKKVIGERTYWGKWSKVKTFTNSL